MQAQCAQPTPPSAQTSHTFGSGPWQSAAVLHEGTQLQDETSHTSPAGHTSGSHTGHWPVTSKSHPPPHVSDEGHPRSGL
jgi:hypothetical protein